MNSSAQTTWGLTVSVMILSKSITGGMWKSNTKYCEKQGVERLFHVNIKIVPYLVVVRAVGALLHAGVLLLVSNLDANDRVHV